MKLVAAVVLLSMLAAGCASRPPVERPAPLFDDRLFAPRPPSVGAQGLFDLSPAMRAFLAAHVSQEATRVEPMRWRVTPEHLFQALRQELRLDYEAAGTRVAAETFATRSGNCLSLAILAGAFARHLNVPVQYQIVMGVETWSRHEGIAFRNGHVNLVLGPTRPDAFVVQFPERVLVIDFGSAGAVYRQRAVPVSEQTIAAMYLNNRAAETLAGGDLDAAYWWARAALETAPAFLGGYNTLAVVYRRHGNLERAEQVLRHALTMDDADPDVLSNLALVLEQQGRAREAQAVRTRLASLVPVPPFYYQDQGVAALARGDNAGARDLFERELKRMPYDDQLHFLIGVAEQRLGNTAAARQHVEAALKAGATRERRSLYASKLERLGLAPKP